MLLYLLSLVFHFFHLANEIQGGRGLEKNGKSDMLAMGLKYASFDMVLFSMKFHLHKGTSTDI